MVLNTNVNCITYKKLWAALLLQLVLYALTGAFIFVICFVFKSYVKKTIVLYYQCRIMTYWFVSLQVSVMLILSILIS